ncbi:Hypothetical predicted protein [Paramuricea clavata]|uniref:Uncharacterized protein n=1 Tax=Paramuricea clavata TaxID=317549 RepID=A0A6S7LHU0_PARCT|nr:Hypothetical predicted protein [Paramuricea clavata]
MLFTFRLGSIFQKHLTLGRSVGVISFVVFDGSPLPAKANEAAKRQRILDDTTSINLASGNLDPKSGVKVKVFIKNDNQNTTNEDQSASEETDNETNENERLEVDIIQIDPIPFPYKIPSFPVITVNLRKVKYICEGKEYEGLIKDEGPRSITLGHYACMSSCSIEIDNKSFLVLWELSRYLPANVPTTSGSDDNPTDELGEPYCLPFKVLLMIFQDRIPWKRRTSTNCMNTIDPSLLK